MDINGPAEIVQDKYERSIELATQAAISADSFQQALNDSVYKPPTVSVQWSTLPAPNLPPVPNLPDLPEITLDVPAGIPTQLTANMTDVVIDDFNVQPPAMNFGVMPDLTIGTAPALPEVRDVAVPDAPNVTLPDAPSFLSLTTHSFGVVNLHEDWLDKLDDIPDLTILQPAPFQYSPGARYASQLLDNLKAQLNARIHGGTGLSPAVEQALWGRALDRETAVAMAREQEVLRSAEALGFPLPSGVLASQLSDARREYHEKLSGLSRDIAIKQAEMEQQNLKDTIQSALQLETALLDDTYKLEMLAFEASKTAATSAIATHNAALEHFKALLDGYRAYAAAYDTVVKAELSKVEVFKALLSAEQVKADINKSLVDRYKAEIEGRMAAVEIYKARVGAAQTLVELERARIQSGGEQIRAFVATVSAQTAKADLFKASVEAESAKQEAYRTQVQAYSAKVSAQSEKSRSELAKFQAQVAAKGMEWDGWRALLSAATAKMEASARKSAVMLDGYRAGAAASETQAASYMRRWESEIKQYEAGTSITFQAAKINADAAMHANDARMEAAKIGMTTSAQRVASAWAMVGASASISGSVSQTI